MAGEPGSRWRHGSVVAPQLVHASHLGALQQARAFEKLEMFRDDVQRKIERLGQLGHPAGPILQYLQHPAASGMTQRQENIVERGFAMLTFTHIGEYFGATRFGQ